MQKNLIAVLALVILVAGCTGSRATTVDANNGIVITDFTATPSEALSDDFVLFDLQFENVGGTDATKVLVKLFGIEQQWRESGRALVNNIPDDEISLMTPPIPDRNIPGDLHSSQWQFRTPELPQGVNQDFTVTARVQYFYNSNGYVTFNALSESEYRRRRINSEPVDLPPDVSNSAGPLHITVPDRFRAPIIIDPEDRTSGDEIRPLRIEIQNTGKGFPLEPAQDGDDRSAGGRLFGTFEILGPGVTFDECFGKSYADQKTINLDTIPDDAVLPVIRESNVAPIVCSIKIDKNQWKNRPLDTIQFRFDIDYNYYVDASTSVHVVSKP